MTFATKPIVHILGMGSMGTLLAVNLIKSGDVQVIPLFRNQAKIAKFKNECNSTIGIQKVYLEGSPLLSVKIPETYCPETFPRNGTIQNLIITTKTYQTEEAIKPYLSYINKDSNLIMIQNGLGVLEVLKQDIFTNPSDRPNLFQGVIAHGAFQNHDFIFNHAGFADLKIARLPWDESSILQTNSLVEKDRLENSLMQLFTEVSVVKSLDVKHMTYQELLLGQLFKFLINCCINPVTAIVDADNGEIVDGCKPIFRSIVSECLEILKLAYKPLFEYENNYKNIPDYPSLDVNRTLDFGYLISEIIRIGCIVNDKNSSSMRQDSRYLRDTEIDYINGYVVSIAKRLNLNPSASKTNQAISELVELRLSLNRRRASEGEWAYK